MQLQPRRQPGRTDRKAAAYVSEILRLRAEGYTYEAIREALADVGIELSTSALRREVRRRRHQPDDASSGARSTSRTPADAARPSPLPPPARLSSPAGSQRPRDRRILLQRPPEQPAASCQGGPMKLAVINFSGNVGKTTVARHLLAPAHPGLPGRLRWRASTPTTASR